MFFNLDTFYKHQWVEGFGMLGVQKGGGGAFPDPMYMPSGSSGEQYDQIPPTVVEKPIGEWAAPLLLDEDTNPFSVAPR